MILKRKTRILSIAFLLIATTVAIAAKYNASEIAASIRNSSTASAAVKANADIYAAAAIAESGGSTTAQASAAYGVLQVSSGNLSNANISSQNYLNYSLQSQVDTWASLVGNSTEAQTGTAFAELKSLYASGGNIGGVQVTAGTVAACMQFGAVICKNNLAYMKAHNGQCQDAGSGVNINDAIKNGNVQSASLDGNGQSICSWGAVIDGKAGNTTPSTANEMDKLSVAMAHANDISSSICWACEAVATSFNLIETLVTAIPDALGKQLNVIFAIVFAIYLCFKVTENFFFPLAVHRTGPVYWIIIRFTIAMLIIISNDIYSGYLVEYALGPALGLGGTLGSKISLIAIEAFDAS
jgi:hypothetical protein